MEYGHVPVLRDAVVDLIALGPDGIVLDGTVGLGGHAEAIFEPLPSVQTPRDSTSTRRRSTSRGAGCGRSASACSSCTAATRGSTSICALPGFERAAASCWISAFRRCRSIAADRGFSYRLDGPLDMRMDPQATTVGGGVARSRDRRAKSRGVCASSGKSLWLGVSPGTSWRGAAAAPLRTTAELAAVVARMVSGRKPVSTLARVFQGVRVVVNGELENLREGSRRALGVLAPGSIFAILSYHSLEDRAVKQFFRRQVEGCVCPPGLPRCGCGFVAGFRLLTRQGGASRRRGSRRESARAQRAPAGLAARRLSGLQCVGWSETGRARECGPCRRGGWGRCASHVMWRPSAAALARWADGIDPWHRGRSTTSWRRRSSWCWRSSTSASGTSPCK